MGPNKLNVVVLLVNRIMQWSSAVIVMGLTSYFIHRGLRGEHSKYTEVIVCAEDLRLQIKFSKANHTFLD
jgi:hypothetical protein